MSSIMAYYLFHLVYNTRGLSYYLAVVMTCFHATERMSSYTAMLSFFTLFLFLQGCIKRGTPIVVLATPEFVPQSQPDSLVETGIGQDPSTGGILLQWYAVQGAAGYRVYRSDTAGADGVPFMFSVVRNVASSSGLSDTSIVDGVVTVGTKYFYYLRAYSSDGSLSTPSDTTDYKLLSRPYLSYPAPNETMTRFKLYFIWGDRTGGGFTVIRVKDITAIPAEYIWITPRFTIYGGTSSVARYNFDSTATASLISGHSYQWRVDRFDVDGTGRPYEGSRSAWGTFVVE